MFPVRPGFHADEKGSECMVMRGGAKGSNLCFKIPMVVMLKRD